MTDKTILVTNRPIFLLLMFNFFQNKNFILSECLNLLSVILSKISVMSGKYDRFRSLGLSYWGQFIFNLEQRDNKKGFDTSMVSELLLFKPLEYH